MPVPTLFRSSGSAESGFDTALLRPELAGWPSRWESPAGDEGISSLNPGGAGSYATLHSYIANALVGYTMGDMAPFTLVRISPETYAVEAPIPAEDGRTAQSLLLATASANGEFMASVCRPDGMGRYMALRPWGTQEFTDQGVPMEALFAMFMLLAAALDCRKEDMLRWLTRPYADHDWSVPDPAVYRFCDAVYGAASGSLLVPKIRGGQVDALTKSFVQTGSLAGTILCGPFPRVLFGPEAGQEMLSHICLTAAEAKKRFQAFRESRTWTPEEQMFIPVFPDDFPVPQEVMDIAHDFVSSRSAKRPMVNFMWRGSTSFGKSTGAQLVACILGVPFVAVPCSSTMETADFLCKVVPDPGDRPASVPSFKTIALEPAEAYFHLTGQENPDATPQECLDLVSARSATSGNRFLHVQGDFITALSRGWVMEIQEMSRIKDPGVMVGLNPYSEPGAVIPLLDGSHTRRDPLALCIYTDNVSYASCHTIDESVLRRMAYIIDSGELTKDQVLDRVRFNTGFPDEELLDRMYTIWAGIAAYCREQEISSAISSSELEMWCMCVMNDGMNTANLKKHCQRCVIAKATSDAEEQAAITGATIDIMVKTA